jgi:hypothetical protein
MRYFLCLLCVITSTTLAVDFPGPLPGGAKSSSAGGVFTLENADISQSWKVTGGKLAPVGLTNKLTGAAFDQSERELFALATAPTEQKAIGTFVAVRLDADKVSALASQDGRTWTELESYPRASFPGEPKLVRLGKMNLKAESKDYAGEAGVVGTGSISQIDAHPPFEFTTPANHAATTEFAFPSGKNFISCQIDKGTDKGESWGPAMALVWNEGGKFILVGVRDSKGVFNVSTAEGENIVGSSRLATFPDFNLKSSAFRLVGLPIVAPVKTIDGTARPADKIPGVGISAELVSDTGVHARWQAELRDGSNYIRQTLALSSPDKTIPLFGVEMVDLSLPGAQTVGKCPGSPVAGDDFFTGVEMPGAQNSVNAPDDPTNAKIGFGCKLQLSPDQQYQFGSVTGVAARAQLRRSFLFYIERERARQSSPFLHYNDWYDLGFSVTAAKLLDAARQFDAELVKKRGVPVQSYLVDDGWDNPSAGLWQENHKTFPDGFAGVKTKLEAMNSHLSIWISPLGGYGGADVRTEDARKMGLIPADGKLDFSYPAYKQWFQNRCLQLMREDGVNGFKWDKAGDGVSPHFMALLDVAANLRKANPNLFINVTVGTWPSPFWLNHIDSTWRNGSADVGWAGKGDKRETWITFRDGNTRKLFCQTAPLYPLNSIMAHGIVEGRCFQGKNVAEAGCNLRHEARSYFAIGTSLQELYLTPSLMNDQAWDDIADAAKWAKSNADVLVDSHWVGGDPLKLEPYGYASWSPRKGTLMVRNPDDVSRTIELEAGKVFDLPEGAAGHYSLVSPFKDQRLQTLELKAGETRTVTLDPFEVLVFDANAN